MMGKYILYSFIGGWIIQSRHLTMKSLIGSREFQGTPRVFSEVWLGEYQGKKVAIRLAIRRGRDYETSKKMWTEAANMT